MPYLLRGVGCWGVPLDCHDTSSKTETRPEKESKLPKETKEAVEETAVADTTSLGLNVSFLSNCNNRTE